MENKKITSRDFIKHVEISIIILSILSGIFVFIFFKNLNYALSVLAGSLIGYLNFRSTKNDGTKVLNDVKIGFSPKKGIFLYMSKFYMRLFATGVLVYFFIKFLKLHPLWILFGLTIVYLQIIYVSFKKFYLRKIEIV